MSSGDTGLDPAALPEDVDFQFYTVRPMPNEDSPKKLRARLEETLQDLAHNFRRYPTLPADPANPMQELPHARSNDCGLLLPPEHCAFLGCRWCGKEEEQLIAHIITGHMDLSRPAMESFKRLRPMTHCDFDSYILALSVHNESCSCYSSRGSSGFIFD